MRKFVMVVIFFSASRLLAQGVVTDGTMRSFINTARIDAERMTNREDALAQAEIMSKGAEEAFKKAEEAKTAGNMKEYESYAAQEDVLRTAAQAYTDRAGQFK